jgi:hypothetical protein
VNIFLVPYTWMRHVNVALVCGGAGLLAWWLVLAATMRLMWWGEAGDGPVFLGAVASFTAGSSMLAEHALRRDELWKRVVFPLLAALLALAFSEASWWTWNNISGPLLFSGDAAEDLGDPSLVALRYRIVPFFMTGIATGVGCVVARKGAGFFTQLGAGVAAGLVAAAVWYVGAYSGWTLGRSDLYLASAGAAFSFAAVFGLGAWGIPDSLYAGWIRVVTERRHGRRIPVDPPDGTTRERFVGHFPRGLDLFLPHEDGVLELHVSVLVDKNQVYRLRGLTLAPTRVARFLESIDLRYDPRRAAPLETRLQSGDRVFLGKGKEQTVVEFLMLPKEER